MSTNVMSSGTANGGRAAGQRALHERRPDRQRRLRAAEAERLVVVEADPHHGQQSGVKPTNHASRRSLVVPVLPAASSAEARRAHGGGGAFVQDAAHHVGDEVGRVGARDAFGGRSFADDLRRRRAGSAAAAAARASRRRW